MNYKILIYTLLALSFGTQWCMKKDLLDQYIEMKLGVKKDFLSLFLKRYGPPVEICNLIETHKERIMNKKRYWYFGTKPFGVVDEVPGVFFKGTNNIERLINALRMKNCIDTYNLDALGVAKKYIYKIDDEFIIFSEEIKALQPDEKLSLDLRTVQQLLKFANETGYADWADLKPPFKIPFLPGYRRNFIYDINKKLVCIDTEDRSFQFEQIVESQMHISRFNSFYSFVTTRNTATQEAIDWLLEQKIGRSTFAASGGPLIKGIICWYLRSTHSASSILPKSSEFDDPDIDFEDVKIQFNEAVNSIASQKKDRTKLLKKDVNFEEKFEASAYGPGFIGLL